MKNLLLVLIILMVSACAITDPATRYAKTYEDKSWEHYQDNWMDREIDQAKAIRKQRKRRVKDSVDLANHKDKIARIKGL